MTFWTAYVAEPQKSAVHVEHLKMKRIPKTRKPRSPLNASTVTSESIGEESEEDRITSGRTQMRSSELKATMATKRRTMKWSRLSRRRVKSIAARVSCMVMTNNGGPPA